MQRRRRRMQRLLQRPPRLKSLRNTLGGHAKNSSVRTFSPRTNRYQRESLQSVRPLRRLCSAARLLLPLGRLSCPCILPLLPYPTQRCQSEEVLHMNKYVLFMTVYFLFVLIFRVLITVLLASLKDWLCIGQAFWSSFNEFYPSAM